MGLALDQLHPPAPVLAKAAAANHLSYTGAAYALLTLVNAAGYPEITHPANAQYGCQSLVAGNTAQSIVARIFDVNGGAFFLSQDTASGSQSAFPFRFSPSSYYVNNNAASVTLGRVANEWHHYGATFASGQAGGLVGYKDGVQVAQKDAPAYTLSSLYAYTTMGFFAFYPPCRWTGSWQNAVVLNVALTAAQAADSDDSGRATTVVAGKGSTVLDQSGGQATTWLWTNGFKGILGEFGWAPNDGQSLGGVASIEGKALLDFMSSNSDVWAV